MRAKEFSKAWEIVRERERERENRVLQIGSKSNVFKFSCNELLNFVLEVLPLRPLKQTLKYMFKKLAFHTFNQYLDYLQFDIDICYPLSFLTSKLYFELKF